MNKITCLGPDPVMKALIARISALAGLNVSSQFFSLDCEVTYELYLYSTGWSYRRKFDNNFSLDREVMYIEDYERI